MNKFEEKQARKGYLYAQNQIRKSINSKSDFIIPTLIDNLYSAKTFDDFTYFDIGIQDYLILHNKLKNITAPYHFTDEYIKYKNKQCSIDIIDQSSYNIFY